MHSLIHLTDDAERFGPLDNISAFQFENYMQTLKRMVRTHSNELSQVIRRVSEQQYVFGLTKHNEEMNNVQNRFRTLNRVGNDCYMLRSGEIIKIISLSNNVIVYKKFVSKTSIQMDCIQSAKLGIYRLSNLSSVDYTCFCDKICRKVMLLPYNIDNNVNEFVSMPFCTVDD